MAFQQGNNDKFLKALEKWRRTYASTLGQQSKPVASPLMQLQQDIANSQRVYGVPTTRQQG